MSEFVTYEKFATTAELKAFAELLRAENIPFELEDDVEIFDVSFANANHHRDYRIKLYPEDFARVDELRNRLAEVDPDEIAPDYYLFQFTDEELIDLISKQDEWSPFDFQLAQKILKKRGKEISAQQLTVLKEQRMDELAQPEKDDRYWVIIGYILAFLFSFFGIIMGIYMLSSKKTLPNGQRVHSFNQSTRNSGMIILLISCVVFALVMILRLFRVFFIFNL
ncbi:hypothetical protein [Fluviicola chungangensis]|uniref:Uncharacterized protein n=1 Tax=Fluviicola chungangensis TaxID=2597671 RepID=A0A556N6K5_9FLAO|nr:hypothetical protein [Fluviicola chungangensis]TSJ47814.1 hypothetical protein FO442_01415 [Fluviicola chungangensis]